MSQIKGTQIQDGSITSDDVDDALEHDLTRARVTTSDLTPGFLSSKIVQGTGVTIDVLGAAGTDQTLRISATGGGGGGGGGGSSLAVSGSLGATQYAGTPSTVVFDDATGFQVADVGGGTAKITIASHFKYVAVSGFDTLVATGSDTFSVFSYGGINVYTNLLDDAGLATRKDLVIDGTALSSSLASRMTSMETSVSASFYVQAQTSYGLSPWAGSSVNYARADHVHGTPPIPTHAALGSLAWSGSGHTGAATAVAAWNGAGAASVVQSTADETMLVRRGGVLQWVPLVVGVAFLKGDAGTDSVYFDTAQAEYYQGAVV